MAVRKERGKNHETYSICPRHGIDRESFRHDERDEGPSSEENRPERDIITLLLRGDSSSVTEDVTIMSQEGVSTQFRRRPAVAFHRSDSLPLNSIFFFLSPPRNVRPDVEGTDIRFPNF